MKGSINNDAKGKQHMKTRKILKVRISNEAIIEQLQNGRCTLARGIDIPYAYGWQLEDPARTDEQQKALNEYHSIIDNISEWKMITNDLMIKSNKKWYKVKYEIVTDIEVYYDEFETVFHLTFDIYEQTKDGGFICQWYVQGF